MAGLSVRQNRSVEELLKPIRLSLLECIAAVRPIVEIDLVCHAVSTGTVGSCLAIPITAFP